MHGKILKSFLSMQYEFFSKLPATCKNLLSPDSVLVMSAKKISTTSKKTVFESLSVFVSTQNLQETGFWLLFLKSCLPENVKK